MFAAPGDSTRLTLITLLCAVKVGRERLWQLEPAGIEEARRTLEIIGRQWETALGSLKRFAESSWDI